MGWEFHMPWFYNQGTWVWRAQIYFSLLWSKLRGQSRDPLSGSFNSILPSLSPMLAHELLSLCFLRSMWKNHGFNLNSYPVWTLASMGTSPVTYMESDLWWMWNLEGDIQGLLLPPHLGITSFREYLGGAGNRAQFGHIQDNFPSTLAPRHVLLMKLQ